MNLTEAIRVALQSLWANKLRSILTLLGVVIGVGAVIAVLTFVSGINRYIAEKVFNLGADVFIINKHSSVITNIDQLIEGEKRKDLQLEDFYAVAEGCNRCTDLGRDGHQSCRRSEVRPAVDPEHICSRTDSFDACHFEHGLEYWPRHQRRRCEQSCSRSL